MAVVAALANVVLANVVKDTLDRPAGMSILKPGASLRHERTVMLNKPDIDPRETQEWLDTLRGRAGAEGCRARPRCWMTA